MIEDLDKYKAIVYVETPTTLQVVAKGTVGLLKSTKGVLCLLILTSLTSLTALGKVDGTAYAAVCTVISGIFCASRSIQDRAAMNNGAPPQ